MIYNRDTFIVFLLVLLKLKYLDAQDDKKNSSQGNEITSIDSRFSNLGGRGRGHPNYKEPGRYGNPSNNYPGNSFVPNGNQNDYYSQRPQPGYGWRPDAQNPNQGRPHQEPGRYPNNYPVNYPGNEGDNRPGYYPSNYPDNYPNNQEDNSNNQRPNNYRPGDYNGEPRPDFNGGNRYPNNQRPLYYNTPEGGVEYPDNINRPYQNGGRPFSPGDYPNRPGTQQNGQYPPQGDYQGKPNQRPNNFNPDLRPEYPDDILNSNINFPGNNVRPNQYAPNNNPYNTYPNNNNGNQYPYQGNINSDQGNYNPGSNQNFQGHFNNVPPTRRPQPNNRPIDSSNSPNANDSNIPGSPIFPSSTNSANGQAMFNSSTQSPSQKQCQQICPTTTEYNPVCGTNNVTYANPGRLNCARNCGLAVSLLQIGRCPTDNQIH